MTKETKDLGAAPPRSMCEVCGREKYTVEPVRSFEELRRVCWRQSAIQEDRDCFRLAYERAASDLRSARKALADERRRALEEAAAVCKALSASPRGNDYGSVGNAYEECADAIEELPEGTAPKAPPDSSAALLEARRLLGLARYEMGAPCSCECEELDSYRETKRKIDAFLGEPSRGQQSGA